MTIRDELRETDQELRQDQAELAAVRAELRAAKKELDRAFEVDRLIERFDARRLVVPTWLTKAGRRTGRNHQAMATLQLSDTHFDEVVKPEQFDDYNAYNRDIAVGRLQRLAGKTIEVARDFIGGVNYDGIVVLATGDIFSGDIHDELKRTNEAPLYASCAFWVGQMVTFLTTLADDFGKVHVGAVVGNHGRNTAKPIYKDRAQNNIEWLFWHYVSDVLAARGDKRITFDISNGLKGRTTVYTTRYMYEHADEFKGGGGISGSRAPLLLGQHRAAVQSIAMDRPMDWMVVGHFHQYQPPSQGLIMGGSLKGYDEYAAGKHLRPEPPQQGFWVTTPERGPTVFAPIQPLDRKAEGW